MKETKEKVRKFISRNALLKDGARVLVGLSGGPDSVCLARILHELGFEVVAVHCNFHLRGEESMRDERFVEALCQQWGWTLYKKDFDTAKYAQEHGMSIEMAARKHRYDWFRKVKEETHAEAIAVGHHQDDNTETLLLNLTRGTGLKGLCGMQPKHDDVIRPLLCLTRQEILNYLQAQTQDYVTDHTNLEDAYARNKVRLDIMPVMENINQGASNNITSTIENLNEVQKVYQKAINEAISQCVEKRQNGEVFIHIEKLKEQPSPISVLHEVLSPLDFNKAQLKQMLSALGESGKVFESNSRRVLIDRRHIIVEAEHYPMPNISIEVIPIKDLTIEKDPRYAYLDALKLRSIPLSQLSTPNSQPPIFNFQLSIINYLRSPQEGDTFAPFGMGGKRKLLSDFLTDLKLNLFEKERQPLLMDGEEIVWVVGRRSSELYRVDDNTQTVIRLICD